MISCASKASLKTNVATRSLTKSNRAVVCQATPKMVERMQQIALIGTASALLSLSASAPAFARAAPNTSYQEELMASVKARGGAGLPSLTSSPAVEAPKAEKKKAPVAAPAKRAEAPTPRPSINGKELPSDAPKIDLPVAAKSEAPKSESVSSFASYVSTPSSTPAPKAEKKSEEGGSNNAVVLGGAVLVAVAGLALAGGNNGEGSEGGMAAPAAAAPAASSGASDADDEVKKVQAWIAAYKKRSGMA